MSQAETNVAEKKFVTLDINALVKEIREADHGANGRLSRPVASVPGLRLVLVSMRPNSSWAKHSTPGRISVQPLLGQIRIRIGGEETVLSTGQVAAVASGVEHDVFAESDCVFLLTVARPNLD